MSGPWEDYSTPKVAGPWEDYKKPQIKDAISDPNMATSGMSTLDLWRAGAGKAFTDFGRGIGQRLGLVTPAEIDESRKRDAPLMRPTETLPPIEGGRLGIRNDPLRPERTTFGPGASGNFTANLAIMAPTASIPGVNTVLGGGLLGGAMGFIQPTGTGESVLKNTAMGAGLGAGTNLVANLIPSAAQSLVSPFYPGGRQDIAGNVLRRFDAIGPTQPAGTPGWKPTLAEATQKPGAAILQNSGLPDLKAAIATRNAQNNGAAVDALRSLAGTTEEQKLAVAMRDYMASPLYKQAAEEGIDQGMASAMRPQIKNLMERPSMRTAAAKAKEIFGEESIALAKTGDVKGLQYMKQALDDLIEKSGSPASSIGKNQLRALEQTRSDLISTMQDLSPKQRAADTQYAIFSRPINETAVAKELEKKLVPSLMEGMDNPQKLTPSGFAAAVRDLEEKIPKLSGYTGATVENTMSPRGIKTLEGIKADLGRRAASDAMATGLGSPTAQNLAAQNIVKNIAGPLGMPDSWAAALAATNLGRTIARPAGFLYQMPEQAIQNELARAMLDPAYASQLASKRPAALWRTLNASSRFAAPGTIGALMTGNALQNAPLMQNE